MQAFTGARKCRCILVNFPPISLLCRQKNCIVNVLSIMLVNVLATVNIFQTWNTYPNLSNLSEAKQSYDRSSRSNHSNSIPRGLV
jgi:hypothetical protein